jgi:hypothetical protein
VPSPAETQRDLKDERADDLFRHHPLKRFFVSPADQPLSDKPSPTRRGEEIE